MQQFIALKAIITCHDSILLIQESSQDDRAHPGKWGFPGGRLQPGEAPLAALRREVLEETGLAVTTGQPCAISEWRPVIHGRQTQVVAVFVNCVSETSDVRLSGEHSNYMWVDPRERAPVELMPEEAEVFEQYRQTFYNNPAT